MTPDIQFNAFLERLAFGVVIVDAQHRIRRENAAAREYVQKADLLVSIDGRLCASHGRETSRLRAYLDSVLASRDAGWGEEALLLERVSTRQYCQLWGAPLVGAAGYISGENGEPAAILIIIDPQQATAIPRGILKPMFGLTATESRLAQEVMNGTSIEQFALRTGISLNTARTHLKAIFSKTGTHGQADLVRLLARLSLPSTFILRLPAAIQPVMPTGRRLNSAL